MDDENGTGLTIKDLKILFTDSGQDVLTKVIPSSHDNSVIVSSLSFYAFNLIHFHKALILLPANSVRDLA